MRLLPKIQYLPYGHKEIEIVRIKDSDDFLVKFGTYDWSDDTCRVLYTPDAWLRLQWIIHEFVHGLIVRIPIIRLRLLLDWWWDNKDEFYDCDWTTFRWVWEDLATACGIFPRLVSPVFVPDDLWEEFLRRHIKIYGFTKEEEDLNTGDEIEE